MTSDGLFSSQGQASTRLRRGRRLADPRRQLADLEAGLQLRGVLVQLGRKVGQQLDDLLWREEPHQVRQVLQAYLALVVRHDLNQNLSHVFVLAEKFRQTREKGT